ncbi:MAG: helix-turn-helix transcriptional regulator [Oscillospiraceae bacterium]|nr:helix-turn-helix transcriptional regulator [Oscillospiraceae bacterium]
MTLGETIQYYRRRAGLSQEALAEQVGVSRQAVSKWELDEATPEVGKLKALAGAFGITTDQLLSGEKPPEQSSGELPPQAPPGKKGGSDGEASGLWGHVGRAVKRNSWLFGVYVTLGGLGTALVGGIARFAFSRMFRVAIGGMYGYDWATSAVDGAGNPIDLPPEAVTELFGSSPFGGQVTVLSDMGQVFVTIATIIIVIGILTAIVGGVLAFWLYKKGREGTD